MRSPVTILATWCAGLGAAAPFARVSVGHDLIQAAYPGRDAVWIGLTVSVVGLVGRVSGTPAGMPAVRVTQDGVLLAGLSALALWASWTTGPGTFAAALALGAGLRLVPGSSHAATDRLNRRPEHLAWAAGTLARTGNLGTPGLALAIHQAGTTGLMLFVTGFAALGIAIVALQKARRVQIRTT